MCSNAGIQTLNWLLQTIHTCDRNVSVKLSQAYILIGLIVFVSGLTVNRYFRN